MKSAAKNLISLASSGAGFLVLATRVYAQDDSLLAPPTGAVQSDIEIGDVTQLVINLLFAVATFLTIAYMMYGGIKWITSRGDKVAVESARKHIASAIIGIIIVAGTFFILQVVFRIIGAENPLEQGLPTIENVRDNR